MREFIINFFTVLGVACTTFTTLMIISIIVDNFKEKRKLRCKNCGELYRFSDNFCRKCGKPLRKQIGFSDNFCRKCGKPLRKQIGGKENEDNL